MREWALFCGDNYYPAGGIEDYKGSFYTLNDAYQFAMKNKPDWWDIVHVASDGSLKKMYNQNYPPLVEATDG